jgi:hypothetical protein
MAHNDNDLRGIGAHLEEYPPTDGFLDISPDLSAAGDYRTDVEQASQSGRISIP